MASEFVKRLNRVHECDRSTKNRQQTTDGRTTLRRNA